MFLLAVLVLCAGSVFGQQQTNSNSLCRIPNTLTAQTVDPARTVGMWYTWMWNSAGPVNYNLYFLYTPLGSVNGGMSLSWYSSFWMMEPRQACNAMFAQHNLGTNGIKTGSSFMASPQLPPTPESTTYFTLYTDYDNMEIIYRCARANATTGICDSPLVLVNTRAFPQSLSPTQQQPLRSIIFNTLSRYCDAQAMRTVVWNLSLPGCNPPAVNTITRVI